MRVGPFFARPPAPPRLNARLFRRVVYDSDGLRVSSDDTDLVNQMGDRERARRKERVARGEQEDCPMDPWEAHFWEIRADLPILAPLALCVVTVCIFIGVRGLDTRAALALCFAYTVASFVMSNKIVALGRYARRGPD